MTYDITVPPESRQPAAKAPERDLDRTIAHVLTTSVINTGHLDRHTAAAQSAATPDSLAHNLRHARNHVAVTSEHQVKLRDALSRRVPAVGAELGQLKQAVDSDGTRKSSADADRGLAHDLSSAMVAAGHVDRHLAEAQAAGGDQASVQFNLEHAMTHVKEIQHYHDELCKGLSQRLPAVGAELDKLYQVTGLDGSAIPMAPGFPARSAALADYDVTFRDNGPQPA